MVDILLLSNHCRFWNLETIRSFKEIHEKVIKKPQAGACDTFTQAPSVEYDPTTNLQSVPAELGGALFDDRENLGNGQVAVYLMIQLRWEEVKNLHNMINVISTPQCTVY